jgi:hypothetical protein
VVFDGANDNLCVKVRGHLVHEGRLDRFVPSHDVVPASNARTFNHPFSDKMASQ